MAKKRKATKRSTSARKPIRSARSAMSVATNARKSVKDRVAALVEVTARSDDPIPDPTAFDIHIALARGEPTVLTSRKYNYQQEN